MNKLQEYEIKGIIELYSIPNSCIRNIAKKYKRAIYTITHVLKNNGITIRTRKETARNKNPITNILESNIENIRKLYIEDSISMPEIAKIYNSSFSSIQRLFKKFNIQAKERGYALKDVSRKLEYFLKWEKKIKGYKKFILPSGRIINLRGYEPNFLSYVFKNKILNENQIDYKPNKISYIENNKPRWYYPDFYISKYNLIVEIKSSYIAKLNGDENLNYKKTAVLNNGFNYILILNNDFSEFNKYLNEF